MFLLWYSFFTEQLGHRTLEKRSLRQLLTPKSEGIVQLKKYTRERESEKE
jgi:hypothetical protein